MLYAIFRGQSKKPWKQSSCWVKATCRMPNNKDWSRRQSRDLHWVLLSALSYSTVCHPEFIYHLSTSCVNIRPDISMRYQMSQICDALITLTQIYRFPNGFVLSRTWSSDCVRVWYICGDDISWCSVKTTLRTKIPEACPEDQVIPWRMNWKSSRILHNFRCNMHWPSTLTRWHQLYQR